MRSAAWFAVGALAGVAVMARLRPASPETCCQRVAAGVRAEVGERGGFLGGVFQGVGDALGIWQHSPDILDAFGVPIDA